MRKIIIVLIFAGLSVGIAFLLYFVFFKSAVTNVGVTPPSASTEIGGGLPAAGKAGERAGEIAAPGTLPSASTIAGGGITETTALTATPSLAPVPSLDGNGLRYYDAQTGLFYRITANGALTPLSGKNFPNVTNVNWSKTQEAAVLTYPDDSKIYYNFTSGAQYTIPKHWNDFSFSPNGEQFAAKALNADADSRWLFIANPDGTGIKTLEPLGNNADKVTVNWSPTEQVVAFGETGEAMGLDQQQIVLVGKNKENFKGLTVNGLNFAASWSPDGKKLVYSVTNRDNGWRTSLWVTDAFGDTIGNNNLALNLETWVDKCIFATALVIYCGVPQSLPEGAGLERGTATSPDLLYKIDLATGLKTLVAIPQGGFNMENLLISKDLRTLFFQDQTTKQIYKIRL